MQFLRSGEQRAIKFPFIDGGDSSGMRESERGKPKVTHNFSDNKQWQNSSC